MYKRQKQNMLLRYTYQLLPFFFLKKKIKHAKRLGFHIVSEPNSYRIIPYLKFEEKLLIFEEFEKVVKKNQFWEKKIFFPKVFFQNFFFHPQPGI